MTVTYCAATDVSAFLQVSAFSTSTTPTLAQVEALINENEDYIDSETMHAWRSVTVTNETHNLTIPTNRNDGTKIALMNRKITTFASGTDKIEVWNGNTWYDYVANLTEGRNNDYWVDYSMGFIFIKSFPEFLPKEFSVRVTYRFGETSVKKDIKKACVLLTARDVISSDDRTVLLPEGADGGTYDKKISEWEKRAEKIISNNREVKFIGT